MSRKVGGGPSASMRHSREVSMATLWAGTSPACGHQPAPSYWRNFSGNTYLTPYLPGTDFQQGREGQGSKFASETLYKHYAMIAKQEQMANTADSSAHGKANTCGHPACIFVRKTAGRIDSRLTFPKLHLATYKRLPGVAAFNLSSDIIGAHMVPLDVGFVSQGVSLPLLSTTSTGLTDFSRGLEVCFINLKHGK